MQIDSALEERFYGNLKQKWHKISYDSWKHVENNQTTVIAVISIIVTILFKCYEANLNEKNSLYENFAKI